MSPAVAVPPADGPAPLPDSWPSWASCPDTDVPGWPAAAPPAALPAAAVGPGPCPYHSPASPTAAVTAATSSAGCTRRRAASPTQAHHEGWLTALRFARFPTPPR